jgi:hypothetical protein
MKTLDPSIRLAAQRVTAWHVARWRAHLAEMTESQPPEDRAEASASENDADTVAPAEPQPAQRSLAS